jgi:hypothetical protein
MGGVGMHKTTIYLTPRQHRWLVRRHREQFVTESAVVRLTLEEARKRDFVDVGLGAEEPDLVKTTTYVAYEQHDWLQSVAAARGVTYSTVVRAVIETARRRDDPQQELAFR